MASILLIGFGSELESSLRRTLAERGHDIHAAPTAASALREIARGMPGLILLDIDLLPDTATATAQDGFTLCHAIRALPGGADVPIGFVTDRDTIVDRLSAFAAGADDYIVIPFQMPELVMRTDAWLRRSVTEISIGCDRLRFGPLMVDCTTGDLWIGERHELLTPIEVRLLQYLITYAGRPISAEELLRHVWRQAAGTADPTLVRVHMHNLRAKLEVNPSVPRLLLTSPRQGYYLAQEQDDGQIG